MFYSEIDDNPSYQEGVKVGNPLAEAFANFGFVFLYLFSIVVVTELFHRSFEALSALAH